MSDCFSCGKEFTTDTNALLRAFKKQYEQLGIVRYYYRLSTKGETFICRSSSFNTILENEIKPNFQNGAEWAHIADFN